jgi:hypothetical protein
VLTRYFMPEGSARAVAFEPIKNVPMMSPEPWNSILPRWSLALLTPDRSQG